jgi:colicin import membrane protein
MTAAAASIFEERADPGRALSAVLAAAMHAVLLLVLIFGVRWQNRPPEAVQVELWNPPAEAPPAEEPKPVPKVEPAPPLVVRPELVKPEPVVPKPEIVEKKAPPPKPLPKIEPKPEPKPVAKAEPKQKPAPPKPVAKAEPLKPRVDETRRFQEELAREQASLDRESQMSRIARESASANSAALATWKGKVALHIRIRIRIEIAQAVQGNPEAIFIVTILPSYEVLKVSKVKSSGNAAYDEDVERAILKASPLPRPDKPELFERELRLSFYPKDK